MSLALAQLETESAELLPVRETLGHIRRLNLTQIGGSLAVSYQTFLTNTVATSSQTIIISN